MYNSELRTQKLLIEPLNYKTNKIINQIIMSMVNQTGTVITLFYQMYIAFIMNKLGQDPGGRYFINFSACDKKLDLIVSNFVKISGQKDLKLKYILVNNSPSMCGILLSSSSVSHSTTAILDLLYELS